MFLNAGSIVTNKGDPLYEVIKEVILNRLRRSFLLHLAHMLRPIAEAGNALHLDFLICIQQHLIQHPSFYRKAMATFLAKTAYRFLLGLHVHKQVTHAQIAIATCHVVGKGPGQSVERDFLPQAFSDFIYAIIIEEGGFLGGLVVMFMYLFLLYRAMKIAENCKNRFPAYLVMGLSLMLVVQAMVNMAVATGAMPVTGQPLPLVSKGGTSTFITCAYIGMILSVSHTARQIDPEPQPERKALTEETEKAEPVEDNEIIEEA